MNGNPIPLLTSPLKGEGIIDNGKLKFIRRVYYH